MRKRWMLTLFMLLTLLLTTAVFAAPISAATDGVAETGNTSVAGMLTVDTDPGATFGLSPFGLVATTTIWLLFLLAVLAFRSARLTQHPIYGATGSLIRGMYTCWPRTTTQHRVEDDNNFLLVIDDDTGLVTNADMDKEARVPRDCI